MTTPPPCKISFGMMLSLDGFIAGPDGGHPLSVPNEALHRHFNERQHRASGALYGRTLYEMMTYWDTALDNPESNEVEKDFARAWVATPKVVVSTTLERVGPNARLVRDGVRETVEALKREVGGEIDVGGATLAASLQELGLIDEYHLYFCPVVLGGGVPFFGRGTGLVLEPVGAPETLPQGVVLVRYRPVG